MPARQKRLTLWLIIGLAAVSTGWMIWILSKTTLTVDGKTYIGHSLNKQTVGDLLEKYDVRLSSIDIVQPAIDAPIRWGESVRVTRVTEILEPKVETVDFVLDWKRRTTKNLRRVEIQHGRRERKFIEVKKVLHDGKEISSKQTIRKIEKTPVDRLVLMDRRGHPEKIYDLSKASKTVLVATAYWEGDPQVPGVETFSGHRVERGLVAVDPTVFPLGWRLYIPGYGYAYSSDTGSAIKGKRIDLFVESKKASRQWEYKKVTVYMLEKAKKW